MSFKYVNSKKGSYSDYNWSLININGYNVEIGDDLAKKLKQEKKRGGIYHWDNI